MPKNIRGGTGHKRNKNKNFKTAIKITDLAKKAEDGEVYGRIIGIMGNCRFKVACQGQGDAADSLAPPIICALRGSVRRRAGLHDYVLVALFDFNKSQGQITMVYKPEEVTSLKRAGLWDYPGREDAEIEGAADAGLLPDDDAHFSDTEDVLPPARHGGVSSDDEDMFERMDDDEKIMTSVLGRGTIVSQVQSMLVDGRLTEDVNLDTI
jgi:translation initiation factor IF-1